MQPAFYVPCHNGRMRSLDANVSTEGTVRADMARPLACVCLCVDDFGLHAAINDAVLALQQQGRVGATSAMVDGSAWVEGARALQAIPPQQLDVGLHLDLTELTTDAAYVPRRPLRSLWQDSYLGRLDAQALRAEITRQLDAFESALGRAPAYVDGHQHVHQLPQVREALLQVLAERFANVHCRPWLRDTRPGGGLSAGLGNAFKAAVIAGLGRASLQQQARALGFAGNRRLLGVYGFSGDAHHYQQLLTAWLQSARDGDLIMCHPASGAVPGDAIATARCIEFQVLASEWLGSLLERLPVSLGPMSRCLQTASAQS